MTSNNITATQIRLHKDKHIVSIVFNDGFSTQLAAELLRVESPSAEVQGHGAESKKIVRGKKDIKISGIEPVGNYAVRLLFDDGHETGIYSWVLLHDYGKRQKTLYTDYLANINKT